MEIKNLKSNMSKLLLMASLATVLTGCDSNTTIEVSPPPKTEGNTTEVTPTPEVSEPTKAPTTEGYIIYERDGENGYDENGIFQHNHELDLYNFFIDNISKNNYSPKEFCELLENDEEYPHYLENNGEIINIDNSNVIYSEDNAEFMKRDYSNIEKYCPAIVDEVTTKYSK